MVASEALGLIPGTLEQGVIVVALPTWRLRGVTTSNGGHTGRQG